MVLLGVKPVQQNHERLRVRRQHLAHSDGEGGAQHTEKARPGDVEGQDPVSQNPVTQTTHPGQPLVCLGLPQRKPIVATFITEVVQVLTIRSRLKRTP